MTDDYFGVTEPWVKHRASKVEHCLSKDAAIISYEDLQESPTPYDFDHDRGEWAIPVITSTGYPRHRLGLLIMRVTNGKTVLLLE